MGPAAQLAENSSRLRNRRGCRTVAGGRGQSTVPLTRTPALFGLCELLPSLSLGFLCSGDESST